MTVTAQYKVILEGVDNDLCQRVYQVLFDFSNKNPGQNISRPELIEAVFGLKPEQRNLVNSSQDRQIREAIEILQRAGSKVISSSGKPGYRLAKTNAEIETYIAELESRREQLAQKIRSLRSPRPRLIWQESAVAEQPRLI